MSSDTTVWDLGEIRAVREAPPPRLRPVVKRPAYSAARPDGDAARAGGASTRPPARPFAASPAPAPVRPSRPVAPAAPCVVAPGRAQPQAGARSGRVFADGAVTGRVSAFARSSVALRRPARAVSEPERRPPIATDAMPAVAGSLSLLIPGLGQVADRRPAAGLLIASVVGLCGAAGWAIVETAPRLAATLPLLGAPPAAAFWALEAAFVVAALIHVASVLGAMRAGPLPRARVHPALAVLASLVVPGWGQVLRGRPVRAGLFLATAWLLGAVILVTGDAAAGVLATFGLRLPLAMTLIVSPLALGLVAALLWAVSAWDAASSGVRDAPAWSAEASALIHR